MVQEMIGAALLVFLYLTQTEEKTKLSNDPAITTLIISAAYYAAINLGLGGTTDAGLNYTATRSLSPLNPAVAAGIIFPEIFNKKTNDAYFTFIFVTFAFFGALIAVGLFEFVYKKSLDIIENEGHDEDIVEGEESLVTPINYDQ